MSLRGFAGVSPRGAVGTLGAMTEVQIRNVAEANRYEARIDDELAGFIDYRLSPGTIDLVHTEVDDEVEGQGVGSSLVRGALDDIRGRGDLTVRASCPFVKEWIEHHPDYQDLTG